jgi:predicted DNA-binding transcriptional regulator YafY
MDIVTAIKNRKLIEIYHKKYWEKDFSVREVKPLAVKEYRYRWYLVAEEKNTGLIKNFGLDRIQLIRQTGENYNYPQDFNIDEFFNDFYGVISDESKKTEEVILSFSEFQGKFIKSLPLHHSQKILKDNKKELRISLKLKPTIDFIMDLQAYAEELTVIKPKWLANQIKTNFEKAIKNYAG